jgi:hypothetical protein
MAVAGPKPPSPRPSSPRSTAPNSAESDEVVSCCEVSSGAVVAVSVDSVVEVVDGADRATVDDPADVEVASELVVAGATPGAAGLTGSCTTSEVVAVVD